MRNPDFWAKNRGSKILPNQQSNRLPKKESIHGILVTQQLLFKMSSVIAWNILVKMFWGLLLCHICWSFLSKNWLAISLALSLKGPLQPNKLIRQHDENWREILLGFFCYQMMLFFPSPIYRKCNYVLHFNVSTVMHALQVASKGALEMLWTRILSHYCA